MKLKHISLLLVLFVFTAIISIGPPPADLGQMYHENNINEASHNFSMSLPSLASQPAQTTFAALRSGLILAGDIIGGQEAGGTGSEIDFRDDKILLPWEVRGNTLKIGEKTFSWQPGDEESDLFFNSSSPSQADFSEELESDIREITGRGFLQAIRQSEKVQGLHKDIKVHEVRPGETLWTIARKYDINIDTLIGANDIKNMNNIMPGDELTILPVKGIKYKIGPGDRFAEIIDNYGLNPEEVKRANNISQVDKLEQGDSLILPGAEPDFGYQDRLNQMFIRPVEGRVTSPFGPRWGSHHDGIDYAASVGTPVKAAGGGRVVHVGYSGGYGRTVIIEHQEGMRTLYAHLNSYDVRVGERVNRGQTIARTGNSGRSTGPHLHFEVRVNGRPVNPENYLRN